MSDVHSTKKRALIIDDDPFFLKLLSSLLSKDFQVAIANTGEEALDMLGKVYDDSSESEPPYNLVITDLEMPGIGGYDVADYVRDKNREFKYTPVIVLTGIDTSKEEARKHGCAAYIPKSNLDKVKSIARILTI